MLDVIYLAATLALFALVGLLVKGVEKLDPQAPVATRTETSGAGTPDGEVTR